MGLGTATSKTVIGKVLPYDTHIPNMDICYNIEYVKNYIRRYDGYKNEIDYENSYKIIVFKELGELFEYTPCYSDSPITRYNKYSHPNIELILGNIDLSEINEYLPLEIITILTIS